ncbi:hypothetical protein TorRG33x02_136850 [Trema orientale]|uniref:Uncharacterized protein n=1 Tax=Trema orientale TaxID=63057 RepID=A0A2P5EXZ2_TREOI|nr:hypothetical protein TorRG33x02_136850 [Trema orientale]
MATVGPTYHGGDVGGDPLDPFRIPAPCQSGEARFLGARSMTPDLSWAKVPAERKAKIEPGVKVSQCIDRTAQEIYKNWKNELSEHIKVNGEDENNVDLLHTHRSVPPDMTQEVWNKCIDYFSSEEFRGNPEMGEMQSITENYRQRYIDPMTGMWPSEEVEQNYRKMVEIRPTQLQSQASSSAPGSSTQSAPPRIDETLIADEVLGVRRGYRREVGLKLKGAASTSSTAASPPRDHSVPNSELRDFFSQTQSYLAAAHQHEAVLLAQSDAKRQYLNEQLRYMSSALAKLVPGFYMSIQPPLAPDILPMPLPPTLPPRFRSEPPPPTFDTQDNADEDDTDLDS